MVQLVVVAETHAYAGYRGIPSLVSHIQVFECGVFVNACSAGGVVLDGSFVVKFPFHYGIGGQVFEGRHGGESPVGVAAGNRV